MRRERERESRLHWGRGQGGTGYTAYALYDGSTLGPTPQRTGTGRLCRDVSQGWTRSSVEGFFCDFAVTSLC